MNIRVYITLLRPVRTLVVIGFVTYMAGLFAHVLGQPVDAFLVLAVALPVAVGVALGSIVHEPLHRPFIVLLPNAGARLRILHSGALALVAIGNLIAIHFLVPALPLVAAIGLVATPLGLTARLAPSSTRSGEWFARLPGREVLLLLLLVFPPHLHAWATVFPWSTFALGLFVAAGGLATGFSRRRLRVTSQRFHLSMQSLMLNLPLAYSNRRRAGGNESLLSGTGSVVLPRIDGSTLSWVRAMWQCSVASPPRRLVVTALMYFAFGAGLPPLMVCLSELLRGATLESASLMQTLLDSGRSAAMPGQSITFFLVVPWVACFAATQPQVFVRFPISRVRLARTTFASTLIQSVVAGGSMYLGVITLLLVLAGTQGQRPGFADVRNIVAIALLFTPVLTMSVSILPRLHSLMVRVLAYAVLAGILAGVTAASLPGLSPLLFSVPGLLVWAAATAGSVAYYRHRVFTHYLTGDLGSPPSLRSPSTI